jgi:hypothetical protein
MAYKFEQFQGAIEKQHATRQEFIKNILTIASAMLAILGTFHGDEPKSEIVKLFYLITLTSLTTGILTGGLTLYFEVVATKTTANRLKLEIQKQLADNRYQPKPIVYNPPWLFFFSEKTCYISLAVSVLSLSLYSGLS